MLLVPLDGSELADSALPVARVLAARLGTEVTLLTTGWGIPDPELEVEMARRVPAVGGTATAVRIVAGRDPAEAIVAAARELDATVCMACHGRGGLGRVILGSVAEAVVAAGGVDTVLVGPRVDPATLDGSGPMVVAVDGSDTSMSMLPTATAWATALGLDVRIVHVEDGARVRSKGPESLASVIDGAVGRCRSAGLAAHAEHLVHGDAASAVCDLAASLGSPLVALATHGRSGLARTALGSVASGIVRRCTAPVLVRRPTPRAG